MEEEGMRITVVGALFITLVAIGAFLLIRYWWDKGRRGPEQAQS